MIFSRFGAPRFGGSRGGPLSGKKFGNPGEKLTKKKWNLDELPKFEKNFYQEHPDVVRRTVVCTLSNSCRSKQKSANMLRVMGPNRHGWGNLKDNFGIKAYFQ